MNAPANGINREIFSRIIVILWIISAGKRKRRGQRV
jgi:hypothetical protein